MKRRGERVGQVLMQKATKNPIKCAQMCAKWDKHGPSLGGHLVWRHFIFYDQNMRILSYLIGGLKQHF